ncbi:hypothetical protein GCM10027343_34390 [Noviherbaspirillum agri]
MDQTLIDELEANEDPEGQQKLYAQINFVLRETRKEVLNRYGVDDEAALLEKIRSKAVEEHPAYNDYLGALIIEQTRQQVRGDMMARMGGTAGSADRTESVHLMLKEKIEEQYAQRLSEPVRMVQDALIVVFDSGLLMEVRYYSAEEYMISWSWGEAEFCIDTAPVHPECATFPHHLHGDEGTIVADSVTLPGTDCWTNFSRLLDILLVDPLLDTATLA